MTHSTGDWRRTAAHFLNGSAQRALAALLITALCGCGADKPKYSGFLRDYSKLKVDKSADDALTYVNPSKDLGGYDKFMIDAVRVHFTPGSQGTEVDPDKLKELVDHFEKALRKALVDNGYQVVQVAGPGVLRLRIALTDVKKANAALNIHPATKLAGMGTGGATMEAEALDSQTGVRVAAVVDARQGNRMSLTEGFTETGHAKQVVDHWIKRFMTRLNKAHGKEAS